MPPPLAQDTAESQHVTSAVTDDALRKHWTTGYPAWWDGVDEDEGAKEAQPEHDGENPPPISSQTDVGVGSLGDTAPLPRLENDVWPLHVAYAVVFSEAQTDSSFWLWGASVVQLIAVVDGIRRGHKLRVRDWWLYLMLLVKVFLVGPTMVFLTLSAMLYVPFVVSSREEQCYVDPTAPELEMSPPEFAAYLTLNLLLVHHFFEKLVTSTCSAGRFAPLVLQQSDWDGHRLAVLHLFNLIRALVEVVSTFVIAAQSQLLIYSSPNLLEAVLNGTRPPRGQTWDMPPCKTPLRLRGSSR